MKSSFINLLSAFGIFEPLKRFKIRHGARTRELAKFYSAVVKKGDLVFDIGANVGNRTEIFWALGAQVIALEPQPKCVASLRKQFGSFKDITIIEKAVGASIGTAELALCDDTSVTATMSEEWQNEGRFAGKFSWTEKISVALTTLDALITEYGLLDYCKIDVEGFEEQVLAGLNQPVKCLSFEFTKEFFPSAERMLERLNSLDYRYNCTIAESHQFFSPTWMSKEELLRKLGAMHDTDLWGDIYARLP